MVIGCDLGHGRPMLAPLPAGLEALKALPASQGLKKGSTTGGCRSKKR